MCQGLHRLCVFKEFDDLLGDLCFVIWTDCWLMTRYVFYSETIRTSLRTTAGECCCVSCTLAHLLRRLDASVFGHGTPVQTRIPAHYCVGAAAFEWRNPDALHGHHGKCGGFNAISDGTSNLFIQKFILTPSTLCTKWTGPPLFVNVTKIRCEQRRSNHIPRFEFMHKGADPWQDCVAQLLDMEFHHCSFPFPVQFSEPPLRRHAHWLQCGGYSVIP